VSKLKNIHIIAIYTILTLILTHPLPFNLTTTVPNDIGDPLLNTWILAWDTHALLTNPLNLFNANIFYPLPNTLAYSEHLLSTALLALPIQLISNEPILAYNLSLLATFPLAGFSMYLLALHWTKQRSAAFIAGLIFAFAPYRFAAIAHIQLLTIQWLPLAMLFLDKIVTGATQGANTRSSARPYHYLAFSSFLVLQILTSWYLAIYAALIMAVYLIIALLARQLTSTTIIRLALTFLIVVLLIFPFVSPYLALVNDFREARPLSLALSFAAQPTDFMAATPFNRLFGPLTTPFRTRSGFTEENMLYVGIVTPILAIIATIVLFTHFTKRKIRFGLAMAHFQRLVALSSLLMLVITLALVFPTPYTFVANLIPPSTIVRVPARWIIPALFALSSLAAFGYAIIYTQISRSKFKFLISNSLLAFCVLFLIVETFSSPIPLAPVENRTTLNPAYQWLADQPADFALIELPLHSAPDPEFPEVKRLYASTLGWWPLVNGYSGFTPPRQPELAQSIANFPYDQSIPALQNFQLPITNHQSFFLLIHPGEAPLNRTQWETTDRWYAERNPALYPIGQFQGDYLYQILPPTQPASPTPPSPPLVNYQLSIINY